MNRLQGRSEVVSKTIKAVGFSVYTDKEVQAISVKRIISPVLLDVLDRPAPGGLYDPALGPLEQHGSCVTCGEPALQCSGHFGHVDLALPVYNPMVFKTLAKIMKNVCIFCHHFKMRKSKVETYADQLELMLQGKIIEALNTTVSSPQESKSSSKRNTDTTRGERKGHTSQKCYLASSQLNTVKVLINKLMAEVPKSKCENCGADVPTIKSEGVGKIFQVPLPKGKLSANLMKGLRLQIPGLIGTAGSAPSEKVRQKNIADRLIGTEECKKEEMLGVEGQIIKAMETQCIDVVPGSKGEQSDGPNEDSSAAVVIKGLESTDIDLCSRLRFLTTTEVKSHMNLLWEKEERLCSLIWDVQKQINVDYPYKSYGPSMFFLNSVLVTPNRFRPPNKVQGLIMEHPMNSLYGQVIKANINLIEFLRANNNEDSSLAMPPINAGHAMELWLNLQNSVNRLLDSSCASGKKSEQNGVRQLLEKKDGLFRMNLMGKRVNFSCRSVISPDPYIAVNEIGIPPFFAMRLTYPERVTHWNVERLRDAVVNGPQKYPGATHVEDEHGVVVSLNNLVKSQRVALSKTLLSRPGSTVGSTGGGSYIGNFDCARVSGKIVYRHLHDGDVVLVNRQPTLHKPSVMGHIARVLKGEKTLRLHYANCSTYNADFDGDEMNVHFPQDVIGRAEAYQVVNANQQYTVPTSGEPIRGLIQDHIVSAALLTKRDTFLAKEEYHQLVYSACISSAPATFSRGRSHSRLGVIEGDSIISSLPPVILKPSRLWTGKQVVTTLLNYATHGRLPFSIKKAGKVSGDYWGRRSGELKLRIVENELLHGVIDKAQFGRYGLVHAFAEFYGPDAAGHLLSMFSRLFTSFLQMHGFTCGVADLLLVPNGEVYRRSKLELAETLGDCVHASFIGLDNVKQSGLSKMTLELEKILQTRGEPASIRLDRLMLSSLNGVTSDVNNVLFPGGLLKPFPHNCLALMTTTGAKGGLVNFTQISSLLGQQELEGKRVPRMSSGKTLPCFAPWDTTARAGGFIADRFLTGLRPQEYYFHCMAGRDGLVDTAVKTSRSGYLQRCLIKNLECLRVHYDCTVRDSDGSIIQFRYGEDGVDVVKTSYLLQFKSHAANRNLVSEKLGSACFQNHRNGKNDSNSSNYDINGSHLLANDSTAGASFDKISDLFERELKEFMQELPRKKRRHLHLRRQKDRSDFRQLMRHNFMLCSAQPGEPVGVLAAQSIGEPSTQMTLNTFHLAGRGEMNMTLGIPRLREIFMTATRNISTPVMTCPLLHGKTREDAERLAACLRRIRLVDLLEKLEVGFVPLSSHSNSLGKVYKIRLTLYPFDRYPPFLKLQHYECEKAIREHFIPLLSRQMSKAVSFQSGRNVKDAIQVLARPRVENDEGEDIEEASVQEEELEMSKQKRSKKEVEYGEQIDEEEDEDAAEEDGADAEKRRGQETDERGYDDELDEDEMSAAEKTHLADFRFAEEDMDADDIPSTFYDHKYSNREAGKDTDIELIDQVSIAAIIPGPDGRIKKKGRQEEDDSLSYEGLTFEIQFTVKQNTPHILLPEIVERVAKEVTVRSVAGIDHCSVIDCKGTPALQIDGTSFEGFWGLPDDLDLNRLTSNSIASIFEVYGVEAARATIVSEVQNVFQSYGIAINIRHLSLIADFMTFSGGFRPCNRIGIDYNSSPFLKMSFETASKFLIEATLGKWTDNLESPSSRIILGQVVDVGTGCFELLQNIRT